MPRLEHVIYWNSKGLRTYKQAFLRRFDEMETSGAEDTAKQLERTIANGQASDVAVVCYDASGQLSGAMLSHANLLAAVDNLLAIDPVQSGDNYLSFLPSGSITEQTLGLTASLRTGQVVNFPEEPETVPDDLREIGPRMMLAAPRLWESWAAQVEVKTRAAGWLKRRVFEWGMRTGYVTQRTVWSRLQHALAERLVFAPLRDQLGLSRLRRAYSYGQAIEPDTLRFFRALGVNLKRAYGQTDMGGLAVVERDGETVGRLLPNTERRISEDDVVLLCSGAVFLGYYKDPEATARALKDDWLRSGDAGVLDASEHHVVLGRIRHSIGETHGLPLAA